MIGSLEDYKEQPTQQTFEPIDNNFQQLQENVGQLQQEVIMLQQMIALLLSYERECIDKLDLQGAKQTRNRIVLLTQNQQQLKDKIIQITQDEQTLRMSQEQQELVNCFNKCWSDYLNGLVDELAGHEQKLKQEQTAKRDEINKKFDNQRNNGFKASTKLTNQKRKVFGLMKMHNYEEAQFQSKKSQKIEQQQRRQWEQKVEQRRRNVLQLFSNKSTKQFSVLRSKNEDILLRKMKERDNKFAILLKKHEVKRTQAAKEVMKSITVSSPNTKRFQ